MAQSQAPTSGESALPHLNSSLATRTTPSALATFYSDAHQTFLRATQFHQGGVRRAFRMGGKIMVLHFAHPALAPWLTPAIEHLEIAVEGSDPDLTICVWDAVSTGTVMPPPPWSSREYAPRGEVAGFDDPRYRLSFHPGSGILNVLDKKTRCALYWIRDMGQLPYYETGAPFLPLLNWWWTPQGGQVVHAAGVGFKQGGILLVGKGGSGKSTTALAGCLMEGWRYVGDDYLLISHTPLPMASSLFNSAKLDRLSLQRFFPQWSSLTHNTRHSETEKSLIFFHRHRPEWLCPTFPINAILMPEITGQSRTTLTPVSSMSVLKALAPSTLFQLSGAGKDELALMARLVRNIPGFRLALGTDPAEISRAIRPLIELSTCA